MSLRLVFVLIGWAGVLLGSERLPKASVEVLIFGVNANSSTVRIAIAETSRIYRHAGIAVQWRWCSGDDCNDSSERAFILRILQIRKRGDGRVMGEALCVADQGRYATVFLPAIAEFAARRSVEMTDTLAHVIAHELGHLLLADPSHSASGLMGVHWETADVTAMRSSGLTFSKHQVAALHQRLRSDAVLARK